MTGQFRNYGLLTLAIALASCTAVDPGASSQPASTAPTAAPAASAQVQALGNINDSDENDERQRLIDAINRDGAQPQIRGFRETAPSPVNPPSQNVVALNYEQADLRVVLEELAEAVDISIVIDPSIDNRVSLRTASNRPLAFSDVWPLMRLLARSNNVILEQSGNIWYASRGSSNLPAEIVTPDSLNQSTAAQLMQITPLVYISATTAQELLTPLLEGAGQVTRLSNSNTLVISAPRAQLSRVNELLSAIDDDPFSNRGLQLYPLSNAVASEVAEELTEILGLIEGPAPAYQVKGLDRINALLVTAPATRGFDEITRWVRILDLDREEQAEQLFQYRVKNLNAADLANTLTEVFRTNENDNNSNATITAGRATGDLGGDMPLVAGDSGETASGPPRVAPGVETAVSANLRVSIVADEPTNSLLIRANPRDYRQLLTTINQLDTAPLQVMINAVIAQIVLTDDTAFGVDWSRVLENATSGSVTRVGTSFLPSGGENGSGGLGGLLFNRAFLDGAARVEATLEAIAINNDVRLLARPSLTVINNQEGLIRIGAEVPVQLGESIGVGGVQTTNIQYRPTGIELQITPRINDDGVVNLTIRQELSSVSGSSGINQNPIFQNQEIETTVVVRDGENVVLGGLIQRENDQLNTGVPYLNRVPGLGRLFSYQQDNNERRELFIVLRPEIVDVNSQNNERYQEIRRRFELAGELVDEF